MFAVANPTARFNRDGGMRFLLDMNDELNVGRALFELMSVCHPNQEFVYCRKLNKKEKARYAADGYPHILFAPDSPMGKNTITNLLKKMAFSAGIADHENKTPHALREYMITTTTNDASTNPTQVAAMARHKSISSQNAYIRQNDTSAAAAFKALQDPYKSCVESHLERATSPALSANATQQQMVAFQMGQQPFGVEVGSAFPNHNTTFPSALSCATAPQQQFGMGQLPYGAMPMQSQMPFGFVPMQFSAPMAQMPMAQMPMAQMPMAQMPMQQHNAFSIMQQQQQQQPLSQAQLFELLHSVQNRTHGGSSRAP